MINGAGAWLRDRDFLMEMALPVLSHTHSITSDSTQKIDLYQNFSVTLDAPILIGSTRRISSGTEGIAPWLDHTISRSGHER